MQAKTIHTQARTGDNKLVFDKKVKGKKYTTQLLREALDALGEDPGEIRTQTVGAKAWAVYIRMPGSSIATLDPKNPWRN